MSTMNDGERGLFKLSAAIERGDMADARHWLDYIASSKDWMKNEVELGRFSPEARAPVTT